MFAAVFVLRVVDDTPNSGVTFLYILPIILVALDLGLVAGVLAALVSFALFAGWALWAGSEYPVAAYLTRLCTFLVVGAMTGLTSDRLRAIADASRRYFELSRDMLCTATFDGYYVELNGTCEETLGWTREELMARPFTDFVHPDDRERTEREASDLVVRDHDVSFTNRTAPRRGDWRWLEWSARPDLERRLIYATARDVTERRQDERRLREAEERWRRSFDDSAVGLAVVGVEGDKVNRLLAVEPHPLLAPGLRARGTAGDRHAGRAHTSRRRIGSGGGHRPGHERRAQGDATVSFASSRRRGHRPGSTSPRHSYATTRAGRSTASHRYRTSRRARVAELELEGKGDFQHALLESLTAGVVACDADGRVVLVNRTVRDLFATAEELMTAGGWATRFGLTRPDGVPLPDAEIPLVRAFRARWCEGRRSSSIRPDATRSTCGRTGSPSSRPRVCGWER